MDLIPPGLLVGAVRVSPRAVPLAADYFKGICIVSIRINTKSSLERLGGTFTARILQ
jgi:hypothetical protein